VKRTYHVVRVGSDYVSSPTDKRTRNPHLAATFDTEQDARDVARVVGGMYERLTLGGSL
jgi:hypothetical protein